MHLSTPGKVLNHILLKRLQKGVNEKLRENQADFRDNRSCGDQLPPSGLLSNPSNGICLCEFHRF